VHLVFLAKDIYLHVIMYADDSDTCITIRALFIAQ